jgi:magnesium transporter
MVKAIEFDFQSKVERDVDVGRCRPAMDEGRYVWLELDAEQDKERKAEVRAALSIPETVFDTLFEEDCHSRCIMHPTCLHLVLAGCRVRGANVDPSRVDVLLGERYMLVIRRGAEPFLERVRQTYAADFKAFAKTPSFLLFELCDALTATYTDVGAKFDDRVEAMQTAFLAESVPATGFAEFSQLQTDLLHFRKHLVALRGVLSELSTRKSLFVNETTQPFLAAMVAAIERLLADLLINRDILSEALNLYMSQVSQRTNKIMNRLTVVSIVFLPLTFLCGVYGMNFDHQPEYKWEAGYVFFWTLAAIIVTIVVVALRRMKVL